MKKIWHPYHKWECYAAGLWATKHPRGLSKEDCEMAYTDFLASPKRFADALTLVLKEWKNSCEHFLTPAKYRSGYMGLTPSQKDTANGIAQDFLAKWEAAHERENRKIYQDVERQGVFF